VPQLGHGRPAAGLHREQCLAGLVGRGAEHPAGRAGLDHHHAHVVGHHVVQLLGDPVPLLLGRPAQLVGPLPFQRGQPRPALLLTPPPVA
jgi:hypothetical protein